MVRKFRWPLLVLGALFLVVGVPLLAGHFQARAEFADAARELPAQQARARAAGLPLSWAELEPEWMGSAEDAWPHYLEVVALYKRLPEVGRRALFAWSMPGDGEPPDWKKRQLDVEAAQGLWPLLERAAAFPRNWIPLNKRVGFMEGSDDAQLVAELAGLPVLRALVEAYTGRHDRAFESLRVGAAMSHHLADFPSFVGWHVERTIETRVLRGLAEVLATAPRTRETVARARRVLEALGPPPDLRQVVMVWFFTERYTLYDHLELIEDNAKPRGWWDRLLGMSSQKEYLSLRVLRPGGQDLELVERAYQARMLARWSGLFERLAGRWDDLSILSTELERLHREVEAGRHRADRIEQQVPFYREISRGLSPALALRNTVAAGVDVLEFRAREGKWPTSLAEAGATRVDPSDGKPLRYIATANGFTIGSSLEWKFRVE